MQVVDSHSDLGREKTRVGTPAARHFARMQLDRVPKETINLRSSVVIVDEVGKGNRPVALPQSVRNAIVG